MSKYGTTATDQNPDMTGAMSLERKLELLEKRFITPASASGAISTPPGRAEAATFMADSTSNLSSHSFSFTTPQALSRPASDSSNPSNLPPHAVRSRRRPSLSSSLHAVQRATERHLRKVAANSPVGGVSANNNNDSNAMPSMLFLQDANRSLSALPPSASSSNSFAASTSQSNQTLLINNKQQQKQQQQQQRVVAESPPVIVSPHGVGGGPPGSSEKSAPPKPAAARNLLMTSTTPTTTSISATASNPAPNQKRKAVPKRKQSSVKDKSIATPLNEPKLAKRKRYFSSGDEPSFGSSPKLAKLANINISELSRDNRLSNLSASSTTTATATANKTTTISKAASKPPANNNNNKPKLPTNNKLIHHFFSAAAINNNNNNHAATSTSTNTIINNNNNNNNNKKAASTITTNATTNAIPNAGDHQNNHNNNEAWVQKYQKLEKLLLDRDEQLKAVANNRTILQSALQTALTAKSAEHDVLKQETKKRTTISNKALEELLRWKSGQEAKQLRERLATEGARLGRIVYARAGMRAVESWEEGHATKDLEQHKKELKEKRKALEERRSNLVFEHADKAHEDDVVHDGHDVHVHNSVLEQVEATEAVRMHLENLQRRERDVAGEEMALNDEKGAHIRALKRVASEDASRFGSRPKLHDRYILHCLLGKGGFSEVWRAYDLIELREVAVKIHQLDPRWPDSKKENYTKHVSREYEIHRNVRHPRIVSLYDVFEIDNNSFATVLECCKGTDLDALLKQKKTLPERNARAILLQILTGMRYLSQPSSDGTRQGIIHYDLKPGNILFDEFGDAKITDFGLSKIVDTPDPAESMELTSQGAGTYWYLPPECFITNEKVRISNKVDVWSIGVIYFQMLFGSRPFGEGKSQDKLLSDHTMLNANNVDFPSHPQVSETAKGFIRQCLMYDQAFRPTMGQLCENPYVLKTQL